MKLFLPQTQLEEWALGDKADLKDGKLVVMAEGGASFPAVPAVHFVQLVSGEDTHKLVAKVKTEAQLQSLGAEQMADSVILGSGVSYRGGRRPPPGRQEAEQRDGPAGCLHPQQDGLTAGSPGVMSLLP